MSRIRSRNTKLDLAMANILRDGAIGYEAYPRIEGNPDFLVGQRLVVFCDSSFWHGRDWRALRKQLMKGSHASYWTTHILKNRWRDRQVSRKLAKLGYVVVRFWDSEVFKDPERCLARVRQALLEANHEHKQNVGGTKC